MEDRGAHNRRMQHRAALREVDVPLYGLVGVDIERGLCWSGVAVPGAQDGQDRGAEEAEEERDGAAWAGGPRQGRAQRAGRGAQPLHRPPLLLLPGVAPCCNRLQLQQLPWTCAGVHMRTLPPLHWDPQSLPCWAEVFMSLRCCWRGVCRTHASIWMVNGTACNADLRYDVGVFRTRSSSTL